MPSECPSGPVARQLRVALALGAWAALHGFVAAEPPPASAVKPVSVASAVIEERQQPEWGSFMDSSDPETGWT